MEIRPSYFRPLVPNGCRRAPWHDYHSRCIYMISINKTPGLPPFSSFSPEALASVSLASSSSSANIPSASLSAADSAYLASLSSAKRTSGRAKWVSPLVLSPLGEIIASNISGIKKRFPAVKILRRVIMPEHIHFAIFNTVQSDYHLGDIISDFKGNCTRNFHGFDDRGEISRELTPVFESGYHDRILMKEGQLDRILSYISDNPRRRLERMAHPDFFHRTPLVAPDGSPLEAYGNIHLLEDPDIEAVRISRKYTPEQLRKYKTNWLHTTLNCGVLASPFISADEKRVLDWAIDNGGRIILVTNNGFGKNYAPKGKLHDLCEEGRLLIVAPAKHCAGTVATTRAACMAMNSLAADIAAYKVIKSEGRIMND